MGNKNMEQLFADLRNLLVVVHLESQKLSVWNGRQFSRDQNPKPVGQFPLQHPTMFALLFGNGINQE